MDLNLKTYSSPKIVSEYARDKNLQKPEETIFKIISKDLPGMRMLDIGVGAGRTTLHFAGKVKEYIGVDYSEGMIKACREQFSDMKNASFEVMDMSKGFKRFNDGSFDFILISFNSIDHVNFEERGMVLQEMKRLLVKGGIFCFSTHNINSIKTPPEFRVKDIFSPYNLVKTIYLNALVLKTKRKLQKESKYVVVNDGAHFFGLNLMYVDLINQIKELEKVDFKNIRLFSESGKEIQDSKELVNYKDISLYFLCS